MSLNLVSPLCDSCDVCNCDFCTSTHNIVVVAIRTDGFAINGVLENKVVKLMIDSGSSISLVRVCLTSGHKLSTAPPGLQLVSAAGQPISILGQVTMSIQLGNVKADHPFIVVQSLITLVILGIDFIQKHG